jgi:hypothetical protein
MDCDVTESGLFGSLAHQRGMHQLGSGTCSLESISIFPATSHQCKADQCVHGSKRTELNS